MQAKIGDTVRFLNSVGGGRVVRIEGQMAYVDEEGFETPVLLRECVVVASGDSFYKSERKPATPPAQVVAAPQATPAAPPALPQVEETPEGEHLNLVLAFEPADIHRLSETSHDVYFVNDSNYAMYLTVATRPDDSDRWTLRYRGFIEPQIQEFLFELSTAELPSIDRLSVQALPFKTTGEYSFKPAVSYEQRLDVTRLARLHCFTTSPYFDSRVLSIVIVADDVVQGRQPRIDPAALEQQMMSKARADRRQHTPDKPRAKADGPLEVDLHASALLDTTAGLSKADILNYQIDTFRRVMDENLAHPGRAIVFIHGKGEGVLRQAIMKELNHRYKGHDVSDASFREYGFGATKVVIRRQQ